MVKFLDGPAADKVLALRRAPAMLRVALGPRGKLDALDQLDDVAEPRETLYVYRIATAPCVIFMRPGGMYSVADYRLFETQPAQDLLHDNQRWAAWCDSIYPTVRPQLVAQGIVRP